ncbi:DcaP family trimeric outer membrane transporter [Sphingomonas sp. LHG3406-1]|uniref:DcaP family trimeric outer membrane transporter n=1 Tax=Sphingomonas sp. LHG3406-1 TaxID=2804617 RepID=UPI002629BDA2|nr:DcaP family trimeric outer membrane transporter [Sphingomonas sp. LHG3406-1]
MRRALLAGAALVMAAPALAQAQSPREAELEARIRLLEQAVAELRAQKAAPAIQVTPPAPAAPQDGFTVAGTTVKLGGFIKTTASVSDYSDGDLANGSLGRDFYLPQQIPVGGSGEGRDFDSGAKQTRLSLSTTTPVGGHTVKGYVEIDFQAAPGTQGSERTTNAYNPSLRRAYIDYDGKLLVGQEWTNFQYVGALPESTDYVGPTEGTVFVRQVQARYTHKLGKSVALSVSAENPETATISTTNATMVENDDDHLPDVTARLLFTPRYGEISIAGVVRQLSVDNGTDHDRATGWGVSLAGKLPFGPAKRHDLRFMVNHGDGIGHYLGLNFAPDAVAAADLETVKVTSGFAALKLGWTAKLRSTLMASFQDVDYPSVLVPLTANEGARSIAANLFYSPVKNLDFGIEYRHGKRELVSGLSGTLDRVEAAAKYSF